MLLRQADELGLTTKIIAFPSEMVVDGDRDLAELGGLAFPKIPLDHCHNCKGKKACDDEQESIHDWLRYPGFAERVHGAFGDDGRK